MQRWDTSRCLQECWVKGRWCVPIRALSKTDTVGVSAYTERRVLILPYLFISSFHLPCVLIAKLDFQLNLAPGKHDILPFQTLLTLSFFMQPVTATDPLFASWERIHHTNLQLRSCVSVCRIKSSRISIVPERSLLPPLFVKFSCCTQCCTGRSEEALLSIAASKHFSLGGRVTGSLWHGLFVRGFGEWLVSLCSLKKARAWVLEQSKVTAMSPSITTRWLTGKMGWALLLGSNKNSNKKERETTD